MFPVAGEYRLAHSDPESLNAPLQRLDGLVHGRNHTASSRFQQVPLFAYCEAGSVNFPGQASVSTRVQFDQ